MYIRLRNQLINIELLLMLTLTFLDLSDLNRLKERRRRKYLDSNKKKDTILQHWQHRLMKCLPHN